MEKKSFKITFGLKEGYDEDGKVHKIKDAREVIRKWMVERTMAGLPVLSGLLQKGTLFYPSPLPDSKELISVSTSGIFTGELSTPDDMKRTDSEVRETLESLSRSIKEQLKQESVYIIFLDKNWCV